ncbi:hypothetical protein OPV22_007735 [Ensete ventricosum]|uniref:Uncharacterized protein n=1 Tax=Ensete ventricosum TaxID=4639 RepID=A0AAV8RSE8_ENSVE|nr:hypothetical protein OPV22_007735 [Ensete ventricosum]
MDGKGTLASASIPSAKHKASTCSHRSPWSKVYGSSRSREMGDTNHGAIHAVLFPLTQHVRFKSHGITPTFSTGCTVANACCVSRIIILLLPKHPDSKNKLVSAGFRCLLLLSYPPRVPAKDVSLCGKRGIRPPRVAPIFVAVACYPVVSDAANRHCVRSTTTPRFLRRDLSVKVG